MKTTFLALVSFSFGVAQFASAQDPTVAIPTEQSEAAAAKAAATPSRQQTVLAASEKTSPTPKPSSPAVSAAPAKTMGAEATLRDLENKWLASVAAHDPSVAQQVLAEDYAGVSAAGQVMNKRAKLAQIKKDTDTYESAKIGKMDVRLFGNAAVVIGYSNEKGRTTAAHPSVAPTAGRIPGFCATAHGNASPRSRRNCRSKTGARQGAASNDATES